MQYKIKVGAITNAQRGARLLRYKGYKPTISRIENPKPGDGCGFVIIVNKSVLEDSLSLLKQNGIRIMGVEEA